MKAISIPALALAIVAGCATKPPAAAPKPPPKEHKIVVEVIEPSEPTSKDGSDDIDGDGITGKSDRCPSKREDKDGFQDDDGCPEADNDHDGSEDRIDACPLEVGPLENKGCPDGDKDGDSVFDRLDNCPDERGSSNRNGCRRSQLVAITPRRLLTRRKLRFRGKDKRTLSRHSHRLLNNIAAVLVVHPEIERVVVGGHTDNRGTPEELLSRSQSQAEAVVGYLVSKGVDAKRLKAKGYGDKLPVRSNTKGSGRTANKRISFTIVARSNQVVLQPPPPLTWADVVAKYRASTFAVRRCYARAAKQNPEVQKLSQAKAKVTVDTEGHLAVTFSGIKSTPLRRCLTAMVLSWRFPSKPLSTLKVGLTVLFRSR